jgi:hypothetical protein
MSGLSRQRADNSSSNAPQLLENGIVIPFLLVLDAFKSHAFQATGFQAVLTDYLYCFTALISLITIDKTLEAH